MWEYHFLTLKGEAIEDIFEVSNDLGLEGWELVTFIITNGAIIMAFKRPKQGEIDV